MLRKFKHWYKSSWFYRYIGSAVMHPRNFVFCLKYPFWKGRNVWTGKFMGYDSTWYDAIPTGWQIAFGNKLTDDIADALKQDKIPKRNWHKKLMFEQIKEKYGELRLYASTTKKVQHILEKYEVLSICYCINCGKPVRYYTSDYVSYLCEKCWNQNYLAYDGDKAWMKQIKKEERLTKNDIPKSTRYESQEDGTTNAVEVDYKKEYGIDFKKLWGLK